jgi:hypothetical protein
MASMGSTSEPHEGQWNIPSGRRRISGCPHPQACLPTASCSAIICSMVSSIAVPSCTHTSRSVHLRRRRGAANLLDRPGRQGDQTWMPKKRLSCSSPSLVLSREPLEAECERQHQHSQAEETHRPKDEQHNYRCDRIFYMTEWFVHLLPPLLLVGARSRLCLVNGCTKDLHNRFWLRKGRASRQTPRKQKKSK